MCSDLEFEAKKVKTTSGNKTAAEHYSGHELAQTNVKNFLKSSISQMLKLKLLQTFHDDDLFITPWFTLAHILCSTSVENFKEVKKAPKSRNIKFYAREDIHGCLQTSVGDTGQYKTIKLLLLHGQSKQNLNEFLKRIAAMQRQGH